MLQIHNVSRFFSGEQITILYDPGLFPAMFKNATVAMSVVRRNGGVPQAGDLAAHLRRFQHELDELMPDPQNAGLAIIDFESWRPVYRQNFGTLQPYQELSVDLVREQQQNNNTISNDNSKSDTLDDPLSATDNAAIEKRVRTEATHQFQTAARAFMLETLRVAQRLRPNAQWGYYGLPFCFNLHKATCAPYISDENDTMRWLFEAAQVVYPSVYWTERFDASNRVGMVRGRIAEALRVAGPQKKVLAYHRYVFADTGRYLSMVICLI